MTDADDISRALNDAAATMRDAGWDLAATGAAFVAFGHQLVAANSTADIADRFLATLVEQTRGRKIAARKNVPPAWSVN